MREAFLLHGVGVERARRCFLAALCSLAAALALPCSAAGDDDLWEALQKGGHVVLMRHAITTPGVGDPAGFKLDDCATQRNLTEEGRTDARKVGEAFRARRIPVERVVSSPWCRCIETARIAFDATPETSGALSNLFGRQENREPQLTDLRRLASDFRGRGNLVLVSHGSTIVALTDVSPEPAEMVIVRPEGSGKFSVVGRLAVR